MINLSINIVGDKALLKRWKDANRKALPSIKDAMWDAVLTLSKYVKGSKLSGQILKNRTGTLRRSINPQVKIAGDAVVGSVGTNLVYAKTHELGLTIPAHDIFPRNRKALKFMMGGQNVFARAVKMPAVKMPARPFLAPAYAEKKTEMKAIIQQAISKALKP